MFSIWLDYPTFEEELTIVNTTTDNRQTTVNQILTKEQILDYQELVRKIPVPENVVNYAVTLATKTRKNSKLATQLTKDFISWGAGPRASQFLIIGAKCHAVINGKLSPDIEDVKAVAPAILRHRIVLNYRAEAEGYSVDRIIQELLK
jgi:MoxR-like ATPase